MYLVITIEPHSYAQKKVKNTELNTELKNPHRICVFCAYIDFGRKCITMYYGGKTMVVSIRMTDEEKALASAYATIKGLSLSEAIKRAYFEAIEDEYDIALAERAMKEYAADPETISHEDMRKALGL